MTNPISPIQRLKSPSITIEVTQEDIDKATPKNSGHCIYANSLMRKYSWAKRVSVDLATIRVSHPDKGLRYIWPTPRIGQIPLLDFDQGIPVKPFSFRLGRAAQIMKMSNNAEAQKNRKRHAACLALAGDTKKRLQPEGKRAIPTVIGGKSPPMYRVGRRREFGLRAMGK